MIISDLAVQGNKISAKVAAENKAFQLPDELYFSWDEKYSDYINRSYDPFVVSLLPLAQFLGEDIHVVGAVDSDLFENLAEAVELFFSWYPKTTKRIKIIPRDVARISTSGELKEVGSFYSGGVDSLFNIAMKHDLPVSERVSVGITVWGMDIPLGKADLWGAIERDLGANVSRIEGFKLISIKTNARDFQPSGLCWTDVGFGPILGGVANLLSSGLRKVMIGSFGLYKDSGPNASGPLIDRFWSSSAVSVIHFSPCYNRISKIIEIKNRRPDILRYLRVCWKNVGGQYNCGVCEKCLRTKMELRIAGCEGLVESFGEYNIRDDIKRLMGNIPFDSYTKLFWESIAGMEADKEIRKTIGSALMNMNFRRFMKIITP